LGTHIEGPGTPIDPLTGGSAELGKDIYRGCFRLAGIAIDCEGSLLFDQAREHQPWQEVLHGFTWLEHLRATGRELGRVHARALISDWIGRRYGRRSTPLKSSVMARRLMSWIHHLPFYLPGASEEFSRLLFRSMTRQVRELQYRATFHRHSDARLTVLLALCHAAVGLRGLEGFRSQSFASLADLIHRSLYADGGHISRSPAELASLLLDLLPLRRACEEARIPIPARLHSAIERMLPMLRFFTQGDGGIALFQGAGDTLSDSCRAIFSADPVAGRPVSHAVHSGYVRLAAGGVTAIADAGLPVPEVINPRAALSPLAFEFSDGAQRVVINCGHPDLSSRAATAAARLPEAHSTATLNLASPDSSGPFGRWLTWLRTMRRPAPSRVDARIETSPVGMLFEGRHDTYAAATGFVHARSLFLSAKGNDLRGEDHFHFRDPGKGASAAFTIRFHLHPALRATMSRDRKSVMLVLPCRAGWRFSARGARLELEESICFGREGKNVATLQIVLSGLAARTECVNWAFKRIERRHSSGEELAAAPELPL
jgi:uncharacterized heparinase superfamily protein